MNDYDRGNLEFIRSLSEEAFDEWMTTLSVDDVDYALELLRAAKNELLVAELELTDDVEDLSEAAAVLKGIMAK